MAKLDSHCTFDNFVVGPANRLASAAARRAAERPGVSYNPLFIFAASGLGKTHVLGAIARHVERVYPDKEVEYLTPEEFLRAFVGASGVKGGEEVRTRFQSTDILLLDDVQFLTHQSEVQGLLLHTLKALTGEGKQVVLASDRPPSEIEGLGAHLRTQFEAGLLVEIGAPEYETRVAILTKWAESKGTTLEAGVADAIGRFQTNSVNDLEEALHRVLEIQEREDRALSPEEATFLLEQGPEAEEEESGSELGQFLDELSDTVAEKVQAQEAPWRKLLRESAEAAEKDGFSAARLRKQMEEAKSPENLDGLISGHQRAIDRLKAVGAQLEAVGNPWPEAAHGVLKDPERVSEAEALLASAEERAKPFPEIPPGPSLEGLAGDLPKLVVRAADQLISTDRAEYNPLYVWSADGVAARALLHAAGRSRLVADEGSKVALVSVVNFAEDFIHALSMGVAGAWRERWWVSDLLLVDGAEALRGTERAQEELFHLMEALKRRRARIMISGDRPPSQISALDDRLRARLEGGLVIEVEVVQADLPAELRETVKEPVRKPEPDKPKKKDVLTEDLEWIKSFRPRLPEGQEKAGGDEGEILDGLAARAGGGGVVEHWKATPEKVVLEWPRIVERIVEGGD